VIVSINQPAYLPWLGYFDRIAQSDLHILLDDVQIERNTRTSFTNRNKIRTSQGWAWLTVPIMRGETEWDSQIRNVCVNGTHWASKHLKSLEQSYGRAPFFGEHYEWLRGIYGKKWERLAPLLQESTGYLLNALTITTSLLTSSDLGVKGEKAELVLALCKEVGATVYLSGPFGRDYLDPDMFRSAGIELRFHDFIHPVYQQRYGGFEPYMSIVDLLFMHGPRSMEIIRGAGSERA
jgi:hypothetical protein